jgi:hypothetical protein
MILKFTANYNIKVHDFCARKNYAPQICGYEEPGPNGFHTVLMKAVDDSFTLLADRLPAQEHRTLVMDKLHEVRQCLKAADFVHGDFRPTNIFYRVTQRKDDAVMADTEPCNETPVAEVLLIDFDFAGTSGVGKYPSTINAQKGQWHKNVAPYAPLHFEHDAYWYKRLKQSVEANVPYSYVKPTESYPKLIKLDAESEQFAKLQSESAVDPSRKRPSKTLIAFTLLTYLLKGTQSDANNYQPGPSSSDTTD